MRWRTANPSPVPSRLSLTNGSNSRSPIVAAGPGPVSPMRHWMRPFESRAKFDLDLREPIRCSDPPRRRGGLDGVHQQIDKQLLKRLRIGRDKSRLIRLVEPQFDPGVLTSGADERQHVVNQRPDRATSRDSVSPRPSVRNRWRYVSMSVNCRFATSSVSQSGSSGHSCRCRSRASRAPVAAFRI